MQRANRTPHKADVLHMVYLPVTPEERFAEIVETLISDAGVTFGSPHEKGFESSALKTENKSFAMRCEGRFVV